MQTRALSAIPMDDLRDLHAPARGLAHEREGIVVLAAGTGNPFFTTDTGAALRAAELSCDALFKGTQVDGVYSADPHKRPDARRYDT